MPFRGRSARGEAGDEDTLIPITPDLGQAPAAIEETLFLVHIPTGRPMNSLFAIAPYKLHGTWVFDDPKVGLLQEPFVSGADTIIDILTEEIPDAVEGFKLIFSSQPFPGFSARFVLSRPEYGGNWYSWPERGIEGWLCPALFNYFPAAPKEIYVKASPK